jgi:hypothetical protein
MCFSLQTITVQVFSVAIKPRSGSKNLQGAYEQFGQWLKKLVAHTIETDEQAALIAFDEMNLA